MLVKYVREPSTIKSQPLTSRFVLLIPEALALGALHPKVIHLNKEGQDPIPAAKFQDQWLPGRMLGQTYCYCWNS